MNDDDIAKLPMGHLFSAEVRELARISRARRCLEVGCFRGRSAATMLPNAATVTSVDNFVGDTFIGDTSGWQARAENVKRVLRNLEKRGFSFDRHSLFVADSTIVLDQLDPSAFDFYFYDGDHSGEATANGLEFAKRMPVDSIIAVHDYKPANPKYIGAIAAIDDFASCIGVEPTIVGSLAVFRGHLAHE